MTLVVVSLWILLPVPAVQAADGRIEINQASVNAAGGFPVIIDSPGNFLLTGDLVVPANTDAFRLDTSGVVIDLNGFSIRGPFTCTAGACTASSGSAVRPGISVAFGRDSTVRNGTVRGFGGGCISLNSQCVVEDLLVAECGGSGISVASGSLVTNNRVNQTGEYGIRMLGTNHPPLFAHNTVASANLVRGSFSAVSGGAASEGNSCDDGSCSPRGERRYYLTTDFHQGDAALAACDPAFHMASLWEILNPTELQYDVSRGYIAEDSGRGPPTINGWVRTGKPASIVSGSPGGASCTGYTSTTGNGTIVGLYQNWETGFISADSRIPWWGGSLLLCGNSERVWCVEN